MKKRAATLVIAGQPHKRIKADNALIEQADAIDCYASWPAPTCIIADGPYGLGKYPGEPHTPNDLPAWYAPHVAAWSRHARTDTTLWFWSSELAWALVHPVLDLHGWDYQECCIWDKGVAHIAGNCNSKTIRGMPVVSEVAVRYTRRNVLPTSDGRQLTIKQWVREEWLRSGLPMWQANEACDVRNAATRKYLTKCHLWYFPPADAVVRMAAYCHKHGRRTDRPYFSLDGRTPVSETAWASLRAKWNHTHGLTNVWQEPAVHGSERIKAPSGYLHANQKPQALMKRQILAVTDPNDVVWEPFGGLCSATIAAFQTGRRARAAEINEEYFRIASQRLNDTMKIHERESKHAA